MNELVKDYVTIWTLMGIFWVLAGLWDAINNQPFAGVEVMVGIICIALPDRQRAALAESQGTDKEPPEYEGITDQRVREIPKESNDPTFRDI